MAENNADSVWGIIGAIVIFFAVVDSCSDSTRPSPHVGSTGTREESPVDRALKESEIAQRDLSEVVFDDAKRAQYVEALDADLDRMDYDYDSVWPWQEKPRARFRNALIGACYARGIAPPTRLSEIGPPFDQHEATLNWGSSSNSSKLPDIVLQWIETRGAALDSRRTKATRLKAKEVVASRIKDLISLRIDLETKLRNAQQLLRKFELDIEAVERNIRKERTETNLAMETLRSKRAYAKYLRTFIEGLKDATTDLQYMEAQSHDEFAMQEFAGVDELRQLVEKIDRTLTKYRGSAFEPKLDVDINERPEGQ